MKLFSTLAIGLLSVASIANAQIGTSKIEGMLSHDRKEFVKSLSQKLAVDDETTILRAYILQTVLCRLSSDAGKQFCKELGQAEELQGHQNVRLVDFSVNSKNLRIVLEAMSAMIKAAPTYGLSVQARAQINQLAPIFAAALGQASTDPMKAAQYVLKEIQARPDVEKVFAENVGLRVYDLFFRDVLYWLQGRDEGRSEPWEIAGGETLDFTTHGCRVRASGKFRCWRNYQGKRIDIPMDVEDGYKLSVVPYNPGKGPAQFCAGDGTNLSCWLTNVLPNGGVDVEKCVRKNAESPSNSLYGSRAFWYESTMLAVLSCEKSGERILAYYGIDRDEKNQKYAQASNVAPAVQATETHKIDGAPYDTILFLDYVCMVVQGTGKCRLLDGHDNQALNLWIKNPETGELRDANTTDLAAELGDNKFTFEHFKATADGFCAISNTKFVCRRFQIDGKRIVASDYTSKQTALWPLTENYANQRDQQSPNSTVYEIWKDKPAAYLFVATDIIDQKMRTFDFFVDEKIVCYDAVRMVRGETDYNDEAWRSGKNYRCNYLDDKFQIIGKVEGAVPITTSASRVGRALCTPHQENVLCDFPATSKKLFERPVVTFDAKTVFYDETSGYICRAEADAATCYSLNEPLPANKFPSLRFSYKGISKEFMLNRQIKIKLSGPGNEPWMCLEPSNLYNGGVTQVCETTAADPKIVKLDIKRAAASIATVRTPLFDENETVAAKPKRKSKSRVEWKTYTDIVTGRPAPPPRNRARRPGTLSIMPPQRFHIPREFAEQHGALAPPGMFPGRP